MKRAIKLKDKKILDSVHNSWKALVSLLKTLYKGMPLLMLTFTLLMIFAAEKIGSNTTFQLGMLTAVIFLSAIAVYFKSKNYGEAVLALSAGLLTVYTVTWTPAFFISFILVWVMFTIIVFLTTSIRLSSTIQSIYMEAVFAIEQSQLSDKECEKHLQAIANDLKDCIIGPIEKAETIRLFAYRKISLSEMKIGLKWVNIFFSLTRIPYLDLADFVAVVIKNASVLNKRITGDMLFEHIYSGMKNSPVTPQEYIAIFQRTRHLLMKNKNVVLYFDTLNTYFDSGISPDSIEMFFEQALHID